MAENSDNDEHEFLNSSAGKFRRHSTAVHAGTNGYHRRPVEMYVVRINPGCRVVWFYMLQNNIPHILIDVDFSKGESQLPAALRKQPHREVPILTDHDIVVFEAPAILTYLALNYTDYAGYGITLQTRMMCESLLSWANAELHRAVGYNYIYPQFLEKYSLSPDKANETLVESGLKQFSNHLEVLEKTYLNKNRFLTGNRITIADSYVATVILQAQWTGTRLAMWPKVEQWLSRVKNQVHWDTVHMTHSGFLRELERVALFD